MSIEKNTLLAAVGISLKLNCYLFFANLNKTHIYMVETEDGIDEEALNLGVSALNEYLEQLNQLRIQVSEIKENVSIVDEDMNFLLRIDNVLYSLIEYTKMYLSFLENGGEELYNDIESTRINLQEEILKVCFNKEN